MTCPRCGGPTVPTRRGARRYCPLCTSAEGQRQGGRRTRRGLRVVERQRTAAFPIAHFAALADPVEVAERAWRLRVLAAAYRGNRDALLALWDVLGARLPLVEERIGWSPPRDRPARGGGGRPWLAEIGA